MSAIWGNSLPDAWEDVGRRFLKTKLKSDRKIRRFESNTIKERLLDALAVPPICALFQTASELGIEEETIIDRLAIDGSTLSRWSRDRSRMADWDKNTNSPAPRMFLGLLILGLRSNLSTITLPSNKVILSNAVRRTLGVIRSEECEQGFLIPGREEMCFIRHFFRHEGSSEFAFDPERASTSTSGKSTLADVVHKSGALFPDLISTTRKYQVNTILNWSLPFVLFRIGLSGIWSHLDEILD